MPTLLLADDSVTIRRVIELTFADEGIRVIAVGDGESAIARINAERPDIVLADVGMPGVDGYQVAMHVRQAFADVPVLLLTGAFEPIDEDRARATGCDGVLVKPFEPRQLITTVRELLSGARPAELWPADMPRVETRAPRPPEAPVPVETPPPIELAAAPDQTDAIMPEEGPYLLSVPYEADTDPDLAAALARLEFVAVPEVPLATGPAVPAVPAGNDVPSPAAAAAAPRPVEWNLSAAPSAAGGARPGSPPVNMSLASVFSALLAAERTNPDTRESKLASPSLSEAAVEEVVQKVVRRMTDEKVRKIVLETAERLIREEIDRIKA